MFELKYHRDEATMKLAHPQRCAVCLSEQDFNSWKGFLGLQTWTALKTAFQQQDRLTGDLLAGLVNMPEHRRLAQMTDALASGEGNTEMGSAFAVMLYARQVASPQPQFLIEDTLVEMLMNTDISDDLPVSMLTLPFSRFYIEFGRNRDLGLVVPNPATGDHIMEGAYVESSSVSAGARGPGVFVMFTGSPLGKSGGPMDDATNALFLSTAEPDKPIRDAILQARRDSAEMAREVGLVPSSEAFVGPELEGLKLLAKALLYLNLPGVRRSFKPELTEARKAIEAKKNPSKRAKAEKELRRLANYVLVSAPDMQREPGTAEPGRGVKSHWRRGHYRMQAHGPKYSQHKVVFIQPVLVGAPEDAKVPKYRVT